MTKTIKVEVKCENCGEIVTVDEYVAINTSSSPNLKQKLIDDTIYDNVCPHCNGVVHHVYPLLYHDVENKLMVYSVHPDNLYKIIQTFKVAREQNPHAYQSYRLRAVTTPARLREKAIIFNAGLDDKVIEIIKFSDLNSFKHTFAEKNYDRGYFYVNNGKNYLEFFGENDSTLKKELTADSYDFINSFYSPVISADDSIIVDSNWAESLICDMFSTDTNEISEVIKEVIEEIYNEEDDDVLETNDVSDDVVN